VVSARRILEEGRNCWRKEHAERIAFLVDGEAYFSALARAVERARRFVFIAGWDFHSRMSLLPTEQGPNPSYFLCEFLNRMVSRSSELEVFILAWDFAMIYAFERESLPVFRLNWRTHKRVHFHLDGEHPVGASHHQKIVVVDDCLAFAGGLDLTKQRWDTSQHLVRNNRRVDPDGAPYPPFHDVQMAVDGNAAEALGHLFRERWRRAAKEELPRRTGPDVDPWPPELQPDMEGVDVGIARTLPRHRERSERREIETLHLDAIQAARSCIYIENQFLTSASIGKALARRLEEPDGPEIVCVLSRVGSGWLEESTMDALRARLLRRLMTADRFQRLGVFYPVSRGPEGEAAVKVHAKVLIVDDLLLKIGSANLSNRSMGLDSECDLAVEAGDDPRIREAILRFRHRLLGEHLGVTPQELEQHLPSHTALLKAIAALRGGNRSLEPLQIDAPEWLQELVPDPKLLDPEQPVEIDRLIDDFLPAQRTTTHGHGMLRLGVLLIILASLAVSWRWTPLSDWVNVDRIVAATEVVRQDPLVPLLVLAAYIVGGLVLFPVTALIAATAVLFDPPWSFVYALGGCLISAGLNYAIGLKLGRNAIRKVAGNWLNRLSKRLAKQGILAVMVVRIVPVAPFSVVNVVAGASHIRFKDFLIGTVFGMGPGIFAISVFTESLLSVFRKPSLTNAAVMFAIAGGLAGFGYLLRKYVFKKTEAEEQRRPA
jgi:phospholipase D1/2